ncbi:MAG: HAD family hydrolase, partial [Spirochaetales bacterium]|nr:HAD family hydrolase [Spirochaetales bacterium]
ADKYWKPFPVMKETLQTLFLSYDLYIASGVTEDILQKDFDHHYFDRSIFHGIFGGNSKGGSDKGSILKKIKQSGYNDILFVGDSTKDLEYAIEAEVKFFRIKKNIDYIRLISSIKENFPDEKKRWFYTHKEINFFREKTLFLLQPYNQKISRSRMIDYINNKI